ncbi:HpcH/HpaI aldolase/citrate lyase family protein [Dactylosporangium sucinum]|nr:aldolase/citrate lyase family protein [Dactylosporangium sucinum]
MALKPALADRLRRGDELTGILVKMPAPATIELAGHCGLDLVVLDTEHGPADGVELEHHLRASDAVGIPAIVRVATNNPVPIQYALDAGACGVIVPHVGSPEAAAAAVRAGHYPPRGERGLATSTRAGNHGTGGTAEHLLRSARETLIIVQIEDGDAVPQARAIAGTDGVDAVWFGPNDLSLSLGHADQPTHQDVVAAVDAIVQAVGVTPGVALCVLAGDVREATRWRRRGAQIVLFSAVALLRDQFRQILTDPAGETGTAPAPRRPATPTVQEVHP